MRRLAALLGLAACAGSPAEVCRAPGAPWTFEEATSAWGLDGVHGVRLSAADLDADGFPDLVVSEGDAFGRDDFAAGTRFHFVLMNRPAPEGGRRFEDATVPSGLFAPRGGDAKEVGRAGQIHVFGDLDDDGDLDAFVGHFHDGGAVAANPDVDPGDRSEVLLNDGAGRFTLAPVSAPHIPEGYATTGATLVDVDADGRLDLFLTGWYVRYGRLEAHQDLLFLGRGDGTFEDVTEARGLSMIAGSDDADWIAGRARRPGMGATACDLDGDGRDDLVVSNYGRAWNQQWMQRSDGRFEDVAVASGFAMDDDQDFTSNQFYRCWCAVNGCTPDPGPASLSDCASSAANWQPGWDDQPHRQGGNTFTTLCADLDDDGDMDLFDAQITHWWAGSASDPSQLLVNDGKGGFTRAGRKATGIARDWPSASWNEGDLTAAAVDLDNDGDKDLLVASTDYPDTRLFAWRKGDGLTFREVGDKAGLSQPWPAGLVVADFDLDGDLDVVTGSSTTRSGSPWTDHAVHLYVNRLDGGNALRLTLKGAEANRTGIGAVVTVEAGGRRFIHRVDGGTGHHGLQHDTVVHAGLGEACTADTVTVRWPGGATDTWRQVRAGYRVTLEQGGGLTTGPAFTSR